MGGSQSMLKINFEDMQSICKSSDMYILINTLSDLEQDCLIKNTIPAIREESIINKYLKDTQSVKIIIYGKNCNDLGVQTKYNQLLKLGFTWIYIYTGGLFEWLLLQDIYGDEYFPTTKKQQDILKYKPCSALNVHLLN
jgi:hypothetical protein